MKVAIIGTGAYGLALALNMNKNHHQVSMWTKFEEEKIRILNDRENKKALPNIPIPEEIEITNDLPSCLEGSELLFLATPVGALKEVMVELAPYLKEQSICITSKGIEKEQKRFLHEVIFDYTKTEKISILSAPSFAIDLVTENPIGITVATKDKQTEERLRLALENFYLKVENTEDMNGVELCGAIKNTVAIATGILEGLEVSESTKAMFITKSFQHIKFLLERFDGETNTLFTYAGIGDFLLTCTSTKSRNFSFGKILATEDKEKREEYLNSTTVEGIYTLEAIHSLFKEKRIDSPLIELMYQIVFGKKKAKELLQFLTEKE